MVDSQKKGLKLLKGRIQFQMERINLTEERIKRLRERINPVKERINNGGNKDFKSDR